MEVALAYGTTGVKLDVPDWVRADTFGLPSTGKSLSYSDFVDRFSLAGGKRQLENDPPLFIVNDGHRPTPTRLVLEWLDRFQPGLLDRARFLIACGTHGEPSPEHFDKIFGPYMERIRSRLNWHDCHDLSKMVSVGRDHFGEEVFVNREVIAADKIMVITSVEPHYFAGFTGGRKSFFPGLTDMATIERNHNLANSLECAPMKLKGNPMSEHLGEMFGLLDSSKIFSVQLVVDAEHRIGSVFCGPVMPTFYDATIASSELYGNCTEEQYNLILAEVLPPLDRSLYQIQKALENCQAAVTDGGTVTVVAACADGVGKRDFFDLARTWDKKKNQPQDGVRRFGSHKLSRVKAMTERINVRLYSDLPDNQPRQVFYEPVADLQVLVNEALDEKERNRLAIVHDAGHTVIRPREAP